MEQEQIHQALSKICYSKEFKNSPQNIKVLEFLVKQALNDEFVKEYTLGLAMFGENYNPDDASSKVRVAMYKFRKKLEQYYIEDGQNDNIVFVVKKGQYNLKFENKKNENQHQDKNRRFILLISLLVIIGTTSTVLLTKSSTLGFWEHYFNAQSNTLCFVSDRFVISQSLHKGNFQFITNNNINNESDFEDYKNSKNDSTLKVANFTYTSKMGPIAINSLATWFAKNKSEMIVDLETEFQISDISKHNLIFLGHSRNHKNAKELFLKNSHLFGIQKNGFLYFNNNDTISYKNSLVDMNRVDYTMVSFMHLENDTKALFISSNHDIGTIALCKKLSNKEELKAIYQHIPDKETSFNALFKVSGIKRTDIACELVHIELLP